MMEKAIISYINLNDYSLLQLCVQVNNREITSEVNCKTILPLFKEGDELILLVARSPAGLVREPFQ